MHTARVEPNWNWIFCCPQADISQSLGSRYFTECSVKPGVGAQTRVPLSILLINIFTECSVNIFLLKYIRTSIHTLHMFFTECSVNLKELRSKFYIYIYIN